MVLMYAATADLTDWMEAPAPANANSLLRSASLLVREATALCYYAADPATGLPTDATILQGFKDATTAQAALWANANIDPSTAGLAQTGVLNRKQIGSASLAYDTVGVGSVAAYQAKLRAASELCDESKRILRDAGLKLNQPWIIG